MTKIYNDYDEMSRAGADLIVEQVKNKPDSLLCFASGDSPAGIYRYLVEDFRAGKVDLSNCYFVGLDEWVGMDKDDDGSCTNFLFSTFFIPAGTAPEKMFFFDAKAKDLDASCKAMDDFIDTHGGSLDIMLVGIGMNGHIGLNEPGTGFDLYARHGRLADSTVAIGQKYFKQETRLTNGITLGLKYLQESRLPLLVASGSKKAGIIARALQSPVTGQIPATIFQTLPYGVILLDEAAAAELK